MMGVTFVAAPDTWDDDLFAAICDSVFCTEIK